jgi:phosphopantetheine binding protein
VRAFHGALERRQQHLVVKLDDNTVLLDSGLDSLGFALLVVMLEEELGYDPFSRMDEGDYPTTFGQFVTAYAEYSPHEFSFRSNAT